MKRLLPIDALWAGGCFSWAFAAVIGGHARSLVGATVVSLNLVVAVLFLRRERALEQASWPQALLAGMCVAMGAVALAQAPAAEAFPAWASGLFALGGIGAVGSLRTLGRSFSVLPARRKLVHAGPYRWVRHPAYSCELLMVAACCAAGGSWRGYWPLLLTLPLLMLRIRLEERLLGRTPSYANYRRAVRYRLLPGVW